MLSWVIAFVVVLAGWLHWRAAYTADVRAALDDLPAAEDRLEDLVLDLRDKRLAYRCQAVLADGRAGDRTLWEEHLADALERVEHLERFAPLRQLWHRGP